jgi:hypothetical protein
MPAHFKGLEESMQKISVIAALAAALVSSRALAVFVTFDDVELGTPNGTSTAKSYTENGVTLNVTTADGTMDHIGAGQFAGLWFSKDITSSGTYNFDFGAGFVATHMRISVDAASGIFSPEETFDTFTVVGATPTYTETHNANMTSSGATLATLSISSISGTDNGEWELTLDSATPFSSVSFHHLQNTSNNGSVIQLVELDVIPIPEPGVTTLGLGIGLFSLLRRRP